MNIVYWGMMYLAGAALLSIILSYLLKKLSTMWENQTVEYHMRNVDAELNDLLHKRKDS